MMVRTLLDILLCILAHSLTHTNTVNMYDCMVFDVSDHRTTQEL